MTDNSQTNSKKTVTYTYDDLNRLLTAVSTNAVNGQNFSETYAYDAIGNITSKPLSLVGGGMGQGTYAYAGNQGSNTANPHAVTSTTTGGNTTTYSYDNDGNVTSKTVPGSGPAWYSSGGSLPWYATGGTWTNRKQVTIDHTKVAGGSNLTNFSVLVNVTDATLKTVANGGNVGKSDGTDILFTSSDGLTKLSHEIEKYDGATGTLTAWVKVPTLSATANTVLILYYGNASAFDQQDKVNTWDSNTKGVWHLGSNNTDSTSNANNATSTGTTNTTGKVGDGESVTGSSTYLQAPNTSSLKPTAGITVSAWIKRSGAQADYAKPLWFGQNAASPWGPYGFQFDGASDTSLVWHVSSNSTGYWSFPSTSISDNTWMHVTGTYDGSSIKYYINGVQESTQSATFTIGNYDTTNGLGLGASAALGDEFAGHLDEVKISSVGRSAGWVTTEYNNQNSPSTFLSLGNVPSGGTWTNRKQVTIDYTKVSGGSNLTNFPVLVNVTDPTLKTVANGGNVGKSDGTDILFTSSDGTTKLSHEIEKYDGATGTLTAWVKVPTLSATANTVLILYYGNASASDQQDRVNVWDSNTKSVWHFNNAINDSTSNANNGTNFSSTNTTSGKIADARDFVATGNRVTTANTSSLKPASQITVQAWVKRSGTQVDYAKPLWFGQVDASPWGPYGFQMDENTNNLLFHVASNTTGYWMTPVAALPDNTWTLVTGTYDGSSVQYYVNGVLQSGQSASFTIGNYDTTNGMGFGDSYGPGTEWKGYVDEARVSSVARSAGWIATEYNNQNSPSTFLTLSDVSGGSGTTTTYVYDFRNHMTATSGAVTASYGYDVSGERVQEINAGVVRLTPTRGYATEGGTQVKHIYAGSTLVATVKGTGASATTYTIATDHLTGSNAVSNSSGSLEELMDYYPYGSIRLDEKAGTFSENRKFAGHEYDSDTGLSYMVARYYDGQIGRFYAQDPAFWDSSHLAEQLLDPQSWNSYAYARNNPMRHIDVDGLFWSEAWSVAVKVGKTALSATVGFSNAVVSNAVLGAGRKDIPDNTAYSVGQAVGDLASIVIGFVEMAAGTGTTGGGLALSATGVGVAAGAPISAAGVALTAHGAGNASSGVKNLFWGENGYGSGGSTSKEQKIRNLETGIGKHEKGIKSMEDNIKLHQDKVANPQKYVQDYNQRDVRYQEGVKRVWQRDIENRRNDIVRERQKIDAKRTEIQQLRNSN